MEPVTPVGFNGRPLTSSLSRRTQPGTRDSERGGPRTLSGDAARGARGLHWGSVNYRRCIMDHIDDITQTWDDITRDQSGVRTYMENYTFTLETTSQFVCLFVRFIELLLFRPLFSGPSLFMGHRLLLFLLLLLWINETRAWHQLRQRWNSSVCMCAMLHVWWCLRKGGGADVDVCVCV